MDMVSGSPKAIDRRLSRGCFRLCSSVVWATGRDQQENQCQGEDSNTSGARYMYSSHFYLPCSVPWSINLALRGRNVVVCESLPCSPACPQTECPLGAIHFKEEAIWLCHPEWGEVSQARE